MHHYITRYKEGEKWFAEAWLQINAFGKCFCFLRRKLPLTEE